MSFEMNISVQQRIREIEERLANTNIPKNYYFSDADKQDQPVDFSHPIQPIFTQREEATSIAHKHNIFPKKKRKTMSPLSPSSLAFPLRVSSIIVSGSNPFHSSNLFNDDEIHTVRCTNQKIFCEKLCSRLHDLDMMLQKQSKYRNVSIEEKLILKQCVIQLFMNEATKSVYYMAHRKLMTNGTSRILLAWFYDHIDYPYPSPKEKKELCSQTGLSLKSLDYWFNNSRVRIWKPLLQAVNENQDEFSIYTEISKHIQFKSDYRSDVDQAHRINSNPDIFISYAS